MNKRIIEFINSIPIEIEYIPGELESLDRYREYNDKEGISVYSSDISRVKKYVKKAIIAEYYRRIYSDDDYFEET